MGNHLRTPLHQIRMRKSQSAKAADLIQNAVCDMFCSPLQGTINRAMRWLLVTKEPSLSEILHPRRYSFIESCLILGIDWRLLRKTLTDSVGIQDSVVLIPHRANLKLVQRSEPPYNECNATDFDSDTAR